MTVRCCEREITESSNDTRLAPGLNVADELALEVGRERVEDLPELFE